MPFAPSADDPTLAPLTKNCTEPVGEPAPAVTVTVAARFAPPVSDVLVTALPTVTVNGEADELM